MWLATLNMCRGMPKTAVDYRYAAMHSWYQWEFLPFSKAPCILLTARHSVTCWHCARRLWKRLGPSRWVVPGQDKKAKCRELPYLRVIVLCSTYKRYWSIPHLCRQAIYRWIFNIRCTKSQNLNVSCLVLQLSLPNLLKPCIKLRFLRMKM